MRDGVRIAVTTTMPSSIHEGQRVPAILRIARYWRQWDIRWPASLLARDPKDPSWDVLDHGYVLVNMDVRGSGASFGSWPYAYSDTEVKDGAEVADWGRETTLVERGGRHVGLLVRIRQRVAASCPSVILR
jgi:predicted acyl esterase